MDGRPTLQKRLTLRDLNVDAPSDAESISVANNEPILGGSDRFIDESMRSDESNHGADQDDVQLLEGTSAHEQLLEKLSKFGISEDIDTSGMEEFHRRLSDVTFSDRSYIMDLGQQQASRQETIRKEAFEESHIWYEKALARGMPEGKELFAGIFSQMTEEVKERYAEFHKKQDEWLNQALDDYQKKLSAEQLEKIKKAAPTDDDVKKKKLTNKISKMEKLMRKALKKEGGDSEVYFNYAQKLTEYRAQIVELEKPKAPKRNGSTKSKSKDASTKKKSGKSKSSKKLDVDDDDMSKMSKKSSKTTRTGRKVRKKRDKKKKGSSKSPTDEGTIKSSSTKRLSKKKKEKPERQSSLPT